MAQREFTLLELHFHSHGDVSVAPEIPGGERGVSRLLGRRRSGSRLLGRESGGGGRTAEEESGLPVPLLALGAVVAATVVAVTWRMLRGPEERSPTERARAGAET